jgi:hypothetical protein
MSGSPGASFTFYGPLGTHLKEGEGVFSIWVVTLGLS